MIENIHNNEQVLQHIEWPVIREILARTSHFISTTTRILTPIDSAVVQKTYNRTQDFMKEFEMDDYYPLLTQFRELDSEALFLSVLQAIEKNQARRIEQINELAMCTELYLDHYFSLEKLRLLNLDKEAFHLFKQKINKDFLKEFRRFVSKKGEIKFENHPRLKPLYLKQINLEQKIRSSLTQIINHEDFNNKLQYNSYDLINDHYIIPIKSDSYNSKLGQIISRSDSGHTLYVEPYQVSKMNQERLEIVIAIQEIIAKIELEIIRNLQPHQEQLKKITKIIEKFDELYSRSSFARELNLNCPRITSNRQIKIEGFFHPLIKDPVKNDLELLSHKAGFIISGPNTGGKTATLKSMAIIQLFLKFGLYLPCRAAEVFVYDSVFYFGNDQQQLEEGLSSFSAEVSNYIQLFNQLDDSNLILIDEIFNSTSSEEASALAMAIFKYLKDKKTCHTIVSSHHQTLKTIMHQNEDYISAHVGFDIDSNKPTYKIHIGSPGSSYALNIFKDMTKENIHFNNLYEVAIQNLDNKAIHYEKLLESISQKENKLNKLLKENNDLNVQLKNQKDSMQGIIKLKIDEKIHQSNKQIDKILKDAKNVLQDVRSKKITKDTKLHAKVLDLKAQVKKHSPFNEEDLDQKEKPNLFDPKEFKEGEYYYCLLVNKTVLLKKLYLKKKEAQVSIGNMNLKCPLHKLKVANKNPDAIKQSNKQTVAIHVERTSNVKLEYDCRGMRLGEFEDLIQKHISDLLMGEIPFLNIIHGHGDGVLKGWLKKFIRDNKDLAFDSSDDGNEGSSRIVLN